MKRFMMNFIRIKKIKGSRVRKSITLETFDERVDKVKKPENRPILSSYSNKVIYLSNF